MIDRTPTQLMRTGLRAALTAGLLSSVLLPQTAVAQTGRPTLLQRIRQLIGLNRPIAAGGSRSSASLSVCLITPRTTLDSQGQPTALVPLPSPTILVAGPLNEVRIDRGGSLAWQQRASSTAAIEGPIPWPIEPIQPEERLTLLLRPRGASGGDFARIQLTGASTAAMASNQALLLRLGRDPNAWRQSIDAALDRNQAPLAIALLAATDGPISAELQALRRELIRQGCSSDAP